MPAIPRGQGVNVQESIDHGRALLRQDPQAAEKARDLFSATEAVSYDGISATRAAGEQEFAIARVVEQKFGTDSPEYVSAKNKGFALDKLLKEMTTEWSKQGMSQQGATDLDTGDLLSLERAYHDATGKQFTPSDRKEAEGISETVRQTGAASQTAKSELFNQLDKDLYDAKASNPATAEDARKAIADVSPGGKLSQSQIKTIWNYIKNAYLSRGENDLDRIASDVADDLGIPRRMVMDAMASPKSAKRLTDAMYLKSARARQAVQAAKNWLANKSTPGWLRLLRNVPRVFFIDKVFGHGTVGHVTHAGSMMFDPAAIKSYWPTFLEQYRMILSPGHHEKMMQGLQHDPYFVTARRAGLSNDPFRYMDDYQNPALTKWFARFGLSGNRGFDALKLLRQARFNQIWDGLSDSMRTPEMAKLVANGVDHATGIVSGNVLGRASGVASTVFFAPKLELSRWAFAVADPIKAARIFSTWKDASPEERMFAMMEVKQKARIAGTYFGLLALNQSMLSASGSNQQINFTNPRRSDFLSFKGFGQNIGVIGPMLHMVGLFANLWNIATAKRSRLDSLTPRGQAMGEEIWSYGRGKLSPFASPIVDFSTQADLRNRPLPFSEDRTPAYLRRQGMGKYTWPEYLTETFTPIPVSEAIREVWHDQGMSQAQQDQWLKAMTVFGLTGGTGVRLTEDRRTVEQP